jgi:hypothetical protein
MKKASRLYDALVVFLGQSQQWADIRHLYVLAWMVSQPALGFGVTFYTYHSRFRGFS